MHANHPNDCPQLIQPWHLNWPQLLRLFQSQSRLQPSVVATYAACRSHTSVKSPNASNVKRKDRKCTKKHVNKHLLLHLISELILIYSKYEKKDLVSNLKTKKGSIATSDTTKIKSRIITFQESVTRKVRTKP